MSLNLRLLVFGVVVLGAATLAARCFKRGMDTTPGIGAVGFVLALMIANFLQLLGVALIVAGIFAGS